MHSCQISGQDYANVNLQIGIDQILFVRGTNDVYQHFAHGKHVAVECTERCGIEYSHVRDEVLNETIVTCWNNYCSNSLFA